MALSLNSEYAPHVRRLSVSLFSAMLLVAAAPGALAVASGLSVVVTVTGTSDAATLDLQLDSGSTERVQLLGILPGGMEGSSACSPDAATAAEQQLVAQGPVTFEAADVQSADSGADAVGYIWLADGRNLGEVMLRQGQARTQADSPHAYSQQFGAAQAQAIANQVGIWAPGACASATDISPTRSGMAGFVISSMDTVQQAGLGVAVLKQQVASAPQVGSTPEWQRTTTMAIGWMRDAARTFENSPARSDPAEPERGELASLGQQLDAAASAAETRDATQLQALGPQLDALGGGLASVATELSGLAAAYSLGD
jgi:endonuclease YncB( thermonuclease family)